MARKRPAAVVVLAVLHFVFGTLGLCCGTCGGTMTLLPWPHIEAALEGKDEPDPETVAEEEKEVRFFRERLPHKAAVEYGLIPFDVLLPLALLAAGVGLLRLRPWGRWLSLACAVLALLQGVVYAVYNFGFYFPVQKEYWQLTEPDTIGSAPGLLMAQGFVVLASAFFFAYPVAILIVLTRPGVAAAFRPEENSGPGEIAPRPAG
jgi:hypothetical protein